MEQLDCVVIGGGVIGMAVARRLALAGREVVLLEAEDAVCMHTSSRNSEVIHAGLYYAQDSLKARLCVTGRQALYAYCEERRIPHRRLGKLIVAGDAAELARLDSIAARARANGVEDLQRLTAAEIAELEPAVRGAGGLLSPSSGIVDSHALVSALQADLEAAGGVVVCRSRVAGIDLAADGFTLAMADAGFSASCRTLVNAAGLWAAEVARSIRGFPERLVPAMHLAKGHYFTLQGKSPFSRLVYPVPVDGGLGVHVTLDIQGTARFGPDVSWVESVDYGFDESRKGAFVEAIRRYWPELDPEKLSAGYTGIRPKLSGPGMPAADFLVQGPERHGVPGLVNLFGIESPGLTAALPLAEAVCASI
ncbi:MAG TPA: NAD(P)/FAD-dependent oxidoreductase [Woeseiaceae bacterium]|nr:NAD(P)/FAD-dependent oxidoreductase [Woeseiaceae bacterium]